MGKTSLWLGGIAMALLIAAVSLAARSDGSSLWLYVLWILFSIFGGLSLLTGIVYVGLLAHKHLTPLDILNGWRCTYWPLQRQLKVSLWFNDRSGAPTFRLWCSIQSGHQVFSVNDDIAIGGTYMGKTGLISGRSGPIMAEFSKRDIDLDEPTVAFVTVRIRPSGAMWATREKKRKVRVRVISHGAATQSEPASSKP